MYIFLFMRIFILETDAMNISSVVKLLSCWVHWGSTQLTLQDNAKDKNLLGWVVVAHSFNPSTLEVDAGRYLSSSPNKSRVRSRTARATQRNPVWGKKKKNLLELSHYWSVRDTKVYSEVYLQNPTAHTQPETESCIAFKHKNLKVLGQLTATFSPKSKLIFIEWVNKWWLLTPCILLLLQLRVVLVLGCVCAFPSFVDSKRLFTTCVFMCILNFLG